jgi:transposase
MREFIRIGVDIGKNVFHVHALESEGGRAVTRKLNRTGMRKFFASIAPSVVGMEACGSAHYWGRELKGMGHDVRLMPPAYVKPYVRRGKNDAIDAAAACEAMARPDMRFVAIKSEAQQATLMAHKTRDLLVKQRTMLVNSLRGSLAEFGLVAAKGIERVEELIAKAAAADLPEMARLSAQALIEQLERLDAAIADLAKQIVKAHGRDGQVGLLKDVPGIRDMFATQVVASVSDPHAFKSGRDFSAWLGLTPRQETTGGKTKLGPITKKGNRALRRLLVLGATSLLKVAHLHKGAVGDWLKAIKARKPFKVAAVALANKLARIVWAMMTRGEAFRAEAFARA